ncbi:MAG: hypothetical protein V6Z89_10955 [Desulfobacter sp.]
MYKTVLNPCIYHRFLFKCLVFLVMVLMLTNVAPPSPVAARPWVKVTKERLLPDPSLKHTAWECARPPFGQFDIISLHRVGHSQPGGRAVLFLPGTWEAAGWSGIRETSHNPYLFLADQGVDVWVAGFRNANLPNMDYHRFAETGTDISATGDWTYEVYREDIRACVKKIQRITGTSKIHLAGFSRGVDLLYIYASAYPEDLAGLVVLDGDILERQPMPEYALDQTGFDQMVALFKAGLLSSEGCMGYTCPPQGENYPLLSQAFQSHYNDVQLAVRVPDAGVRAGDVLPGTFTNLSDYLAEHLYHLWGSGVFSNVQNGSVPRDILVRACGEFSRYWPAIQDFESIQMAVHEDVPYLDYDDNPIDLPCIAFLTDMFCPASNCLDTTLPRINQNPDMTVHYLEGYGHLDVMFGTNAPADVSQPLLEWLNRH